MSLGGGRAKAVGGAALLALSFALGAATEVSGTDRVADRSALAGTSASVEQAVELVRVPPESGLYPGTVLEVVGSKQRTQLVALGAGLPDPEPAYRFGLSRQPVDRVRAEVPYAMLDGEVGPPELRCGHVVALAAAGRRLPEDVLEMEAVSLACDIARGARPARDLADPVMVEAVRTRATGLVEQARAAPFRAGPATVSRLAAGVVAGRSTRSAVRASLQLASGAGAPGELVRVSYPGGSLLARTGSDGVAVLDVPDVSLDDELPLRVSWKGSAPAGYPLGGYPVAQDGSFGFLPPGFLLDAVAYGLSVDLRRDRERT